MWVTETKRREEGEKNFTEVSKDIYRGCYKLTLKSILVQDRYILEGKI